MVSRDDNNIVLWLIVTEIYTLSLIFVVYNKVVFITCIQRFKIVFLNLMSQKLFW
jgi:hypothetical protein